MHDFLVKELGRAVPYGVYDLAANAGWVNLGVDHDTAAFAVHSIRRWWQEMGRARYPDATRLLITADGGRWWTMIWRPVSSARFCSSRFHRRTREPLLPPGTSKWNKIEHRLFSYISQNWRARPLVSHRVIVDLIAATTTTTGLTVRCELDQNRYPKGIAVSDREMAAISITRHDFHGDWNYTISPNSS